MPEQITYDEWRTQLVAAFIQEAGFAADEAESYVTTAGDECWREAYDDGLSPTDTVWEEMCAAMEMGDA